MHHRRQPTVQLAYLLVVQVVRVGRDLLHVNLVGPREILMVSVVQVVWDLYLPAVGVAVVEVHHSVYTEYRQRVLQRLMKLVVPVVPARKHFHQIRQICHS